MKTVSRFLVIHDYQHGGVGILVNAHSSKCLRRAVGADQPGTGNSVIEPEDVEDHPLFVYTGSTLQTYDLDHPSGLLRTLLEMVKAR